MVGGSKGRGLGDGRGRGRDACAADRPGVEAAASPGVQLWPLYRWYNYLWFLVIIVYQLPAQLLQLGGTGTKSAHLVPEPLDTADPQDCVFPSQTLKTSSG